MEQRRLRESLQGKSKFTVTVELTSGPNFNFAPVEKFLEGYKADRGSSVPDEFDFVAITSTDNSGGTPNLQRADILSHVRGLDLLGDLDFVPHKAKEIAINSALSNSFGFGGTNATLIFSKI